MNHRVLVTGATGFIGTHLLAALRREGHTVATHSSADGDIASVPISKSDIDHVFHLAAKNYVPQSWSEPGEYYRVNVSGTFNVLEYCRKQGASLTFISSYVYGPPQFLPVSEDHPVSAFNPYSHTKIVAEEVCRYYADTFKVPLTIVRPFNIYGPGQASHFLIAKLLNQAVMPEFTEFTVDDIRPRRDYLFIDDFIGLLITLLVRRITGTFNAGSGRSASIEELVNEINSQLEVKKRLISLNRFRPNEVLDVVANIDKVRRAADWTPATSLRAGLARSLESVAV